MSTKNLVDWLENLLFGTSHPPLDVPEPLELTVEELRLRGVAAFDTMRNGGLLLTSALVESDLQQLLEHFRWQNKEPTFRTRVVTDFYNHLVCLLEQRERVSDQLPEPTEQTDRDILESFLKGADGDDDEPFRDARFWGRLAKQLIRHRRPVADPLLVSSDSVPPLIGDLYRLYDVTCKRLGRIVSPLKMVLVLRGDHVDPIHWSSMDHLRRYMAKHPEYPFTTIVKRLLNEYVLEARIDPIIMSVELVTCLSNVRKVHDAIEKVHGDDVPPKLVDVFQRLLASVGKDHLWTSPDPSLLPPPSPSSSIHVYEKVVELEKEIELLWKMLEASSIKRTMCSEQRSLW